MLLGHWRRWTWAGPHEGASLGVSISVPGTEGTGPGPLPGPQAHPVWLIRIGCCLMGFQSKPSWK